MNYFEPKRISGRVVLFLVLCLIVAYPCYSQKPYRLIIPWFGKGSFVSSNQYLSDRLVQILAEESKMEVVGPQLVAYHLDRKGSDLSLTCNLEDMLEIGKDLEGDLVLWGDVTKRETSLKKGLSIPHILTKYRRQAQLRVTLKLFDLRKGEMILIKGFDVSILGEGGTAWFSQPERNPCSDLSVLEEDKLLREAEEKTARDMAKTIFKLLKKRG